MKHLGKRVLSMVLALGITTSMLVSDMSAMQVYAAGSTEYVDEETTVELLSEDLEEKSLAEDSSESASAEESAEEESSVEEPSGEIEDVEESSVSDNEEETESSTSGENTTETENFEEESSAEEGTSETEAASTEEADTEATTEEASTEELTTEEMTETVVEETTEELLTEEATTEISTEEMTVMGMEGMAVAYASGDDYNIGFELGVDGNGKLTVTFEEGYEELHGKVRIPKDVKVIPCDDKLFDNNTDIEEVVFEDGSQLTTIEANAFRNTSITEIKLPKSLTYIGDSAFKASYLQEVILEADGKTVEIGAEAFENNSDLKYFDSNNRLSSIGKKAFYKNKELSGTVELGSVKVISAEAFAGCESLDYIWIPDTVETIEQEAFKNCKTFGNGSSYAYREERAVRFGTKVSNIADSAFEGCSGLTHIVLPANVEELGKEVFSGCTALKTIEVYNVSGTEPTSACDIKLAYTSFPNLKGLVLKAYDGTVEDWVGSHTSYGVKFVTLYENYSVNIAKCTGGTVTADKKTAKMGDMVTLTVKPSDGYILEAYESLFYICEDGTVNPKPIYIDPWDNSFEMPESDITVYANFVEASKLEYGTQLILKESNLFDKTSDGISYDSEENVLTFGKPWQSARIQVTGSNGKTPIYSQLKFTSSNSKAVTIDAKGNIRAVAPNASAKITVSFANKSYSTKALVFNVKVGEETYVENISLDYNASRADIERYGTDGAEEANEIKYDIITYPSSLLNTSARTIKLTPNGTDKDGDTLDISYELTSNDTSIAKPKASKFTEEGIITVPKGALGETVVTLKAVDKSGKPAQKQFVVRVIDDTPRLAESTIKVDPLSDTGTFIDLVSVYGETPKVDELSIKKKVVSKGNTVYEPTEELFELKESDVDGKLYLRALEEGDVEYKAGKNYTYKNTYYIHGTLTDTDTEFYIAIPNLTICKKNIKPSVKMSGKINLFYNGTASEAKLGTVTVTQNQKDLVIESVALVGNDKTNGVDEVDDQAFVENFDVQFNEEKQTIKIVRKAGDKELSCYTDGKSKGKPVLAGKISIKYVGYEKPFEVGITVPTHTAVPSYTLTTTKISLNSNASGQEYDVSFINKKTKQAENLISDDSGETQIKLDESDAGTTDGIIDKANFTFDADKDTIHLKIKNAKKGKIVLVLRQPEWEDQSGWNKRSVIKATISVTATSSFPTAKLKKSTLTINAACPEAADYTIMTLNQADSTLIETQEFKATGKAKCNALEVRYESVEENGKPVGKVIAEFAEDADMTEVKTGTYSYTCYPKFKFNEEEQPDDTKPITVKVTIKDAKPSLKLKKTSFTLNAACHKTEADEKYDYAITDFSWSNLPAEYQGYILDTDKMEISLKGNGYDYLGAENVNFEIDEANKTAKVYVTSKRSATCTYIISGLSLTNEGAKVPVSDLTIKITNTNKPPAVTVSAKGTINPLDPASKIEYTPKISNINGTIENVYIRELAEDNTPLNDLPAKETEHYTVAIDEKTGKTVVKVKDGATLEKRTYKIQLFYELTNGNETYRVAKDQKITPKQTMPKIAVDTKSTTFFAGNKDRTKTITITKKSTATADISGIKFSDKTPKYLQNAFYEPTYNPNTGEMVLKLKNSAFIQQNKEQTLTFEIECNGQLKDTTGTTFTVKVKVIK